MAARKAVSVLPEPVGAAISVGRPLRISGHAARCASVGAGKVALNHAATAGWKSCQSRSEGDGRVMAIYMGPWRAMTRRWLISLAGGGAGVARLSWRFRRHARWTAAARRRFCGVAGYDRAPGW